MQDPRSDKLDVLTWNLKLLPPVELPVVGSLGCRNTSRRPDAVLRSDVVDGHDVIVFEEMFYRPARERILAALRKQYPYTTRVVGNGRLFKQNGGVVILSRWPIENSPGQQRVYGNACAGGDCWADKGAVYARINKLGRRYHVFGTHLNSGDRPADREARRRQLQVLREFVDAQKIGREPVLLAGDFNIDLNRSPEEYGRMLHALNAASPANHGLEVTMAQGEYLDYVLSSASHLSPACASVASRAALGGPEPGGHVSDHHPVVARFVFPPAP